MSDSEKARLRRHYLKNRQEIEDHLNKSRLIQETVLASDSYQQSSKLALYAPIRNEVMTEQIVTQALRDGKQVYFPHWEPQERLIRFFLVKDPSALRITDWGTREPEANPSLEKSDLAFDLILVPGVVFDLQAFRLGYGYGGYDRILARTKSKAWGLAFDMQIVDSLPTEPHDRPCSKVITESRVIERT